MVITELKRLVEKVRSVGEFMGGEGRSVSAMLLNAPQFFFVSHRVALTYPHLLESILARSYMSYLPGGVRQAWLSEAESALSGMGGWGLWQAKDRLRPSRRIMSLFKVMAAHAPPYVQRVALRLIEPVLLAGLSLGFFFLLQRPLFFSVVVVLLVMAAGWLVWDGLRAYRETNKVEAAPGLDDHVGDRQSTNEASDLVDAWPKVFSGECSDAESCGSDDSLGLRFGDAGVSSVASHCGSEDELQSEIVASMPLDATDDAEEIIAQICDDTRLSDEVDSNTSDFLLPSCLFDG